MVIYIFLDVDRFWCSLDLGTKVGVVFGNIVWVNRNRLFA